ncbi:dUTPase [Alphabaculovirus altermyunipunctae]|uniref:dUTPase n=1 Tax=Mythimna unipuncta nucleopolyhedrovirus TaxID=447897 RepID=A0A346TPP2_9ABAC|nr:dUTPase [Mythimna unipuncta nucleopolyhedrovirus]AXU41552.1 dUTPase [Mythimna unipuncta nucleopolyhedrovirus]
MSTLLKLSTFFLFIIMSPHIETNSIDKPEWNGSLIYRLIGKNTFQPKQRGESLQFDLRIPSAIQLPADGRRVINMDIKITLPVNYRAFLTSNRTLVATKKVSVHFSEIILGGRPTQLQAYLHNKSKISTKLKKGEYVCKLQVYNLNEQDRDLSIIYDLNKCDYY